MAIVTLDGGQSTAAVGGQSIQFIVAQVLLHVPGCPDSLVQSQLQLVMRDFYTMSVSWRQDIGPFNIQANVNTINLNPVDQNSEVQFVLAAWIYPTLGNTVRQYLPPQTIKIYGVDKGPPATHFMRLPTQLVLYPMPDKTYGRVLYVDAALKPTLAAITLPDISFTHHLDALIFGTLARLMRMPKKPWSDEKTSKEYARMYGRQILLWRDIAKRGYGSADTAFAYPNFTGRANQGSQMGARAAE